MLMELLSKKLEQKALNLIKHRAEGQTNDPFSPQLFIYIKAQSVSPKIRHFRAVKLNSSSYNREKRDEPSQT